MGITDDKVNIQLFTLWPIYNNHTHTHTENKRCSSVSAHGAMSLQINPSW